MQYDIQTQDSLLQSDSMVGSSTVFEGGARSRKSSRRSSVLSSVHVDMEERKDIAKNQDNITRTVNDNIFDKLRQTQYKELSSSAMIGTGLDEKFRDKYSWVVQDKADYENVKKLDFRSHVKKALKYIQTDPSILRTKKETEASLAENQIVKHIERIQDQKTKNDPLLLKLAVFIEQVETESIDTFLRVYEMKDGVATQTHQTKIPHQLAYNSDLDDQTIQGETSGNMVTESDFLPFFTQNHQILIIYCISEQKYIMFNDLATLFQRASLKSQNKSEAEIQKVTSSFKDDTGFNSLNKHLRVHMLQSSFVLVGLNLDTTGVPANKHNVLNSVTVEFNFAKSELDFKLNTLVRCFVEKKEQTTPESYFNVPNWYLMNDMVISPGKEGNKRIEKDIRDQGGVIPENYSTVTVNSNGRFIGGTQSQFESMNNKTICRVKSNKQSSIICAESTGIRSETKILVKIRGYRLQGGSIAEEKLGINDEQSAGMQAALETERYNTYKNNLFFWNREQNKLHRVRAPKFKLDKAGSKGRYQINNNYTVYVIEKHTGEKFVQHNFKDGTYKCYIFDKDDVIDQGIWSVREDTYMEKNDQNWSGKIHYTSDQEFYIDFNAAEHGYHKYTKASVPYVGGRKRATSDTKGRYKVSNNYTCYFIEKHTGEKFIQHNYKDGTYKAYFVGQDNVIDQGIWSVTDDTYMEKNDKNWTGKIHYTSDQEFYIDFYAAEHGYHKYTKTTVPYVCGKIQEVEEKDLSLCKDNKCVLYLWVDQRLSQRKNVQQIRNITTSMNVRMNKELILYGFDEFNSQGASEGTLIFGLKISAKTNGRHETSSVSIKFNDSLLFHRSFLEPISDNNTNGTNLYDLQTNLGTQVQLINNFQFLFVRDNSLLVSKIEVVNKKCYHNYHYLTLEDQGVSPLVFRPSEIRQYISNSKSSKPSQRSICEFPDPRNHFSTENAKVNSDLVSQDQIIDFRNFIQTKQQDSLHYQIQQEGKKLKIFEELCIDIRSNFNKPLNKIDFRKGDKYDLFKNLVLVSNSDQNLVQIYTCFDNFGFLLLDYLTLDSDYKMVDAKFDNNDGAPTILCRVTQKKQACEKYIVMKTENYDFKNLKIVKEFDLNTFDKQIESVSNQTSFDNWQKQVKNSEFVGQELTEYGDDSTFIDGIAKLSKKLGVKDKHKLPQMLSLKAQIYTSDYNNHRTKFIYGLDIRYGFVEEKQGAEVRKEIWRQDMTIKFPCVECKEKTFIFKKDEYIADIFVRTDPVEGIEQLQFITNFGNIFKTKSHSGKIAQVRQFNNQRLVAINSDFSGILSNLQFVFINLDDFNKTNVIPQQQVVSYKISKENICLFKHNGSIFRIGNENKSHQPSSVLPQNINSIIQPQNSNYAMIVTEKEKQKDQEKILLNLINGELLNLSTIFDPLVSEINVDLGVSITMNQPNSIQVTFNHKTLEFSISELFSAQANQLYTIINRKNGPIEAHQDQSQATTALIDKASQNPLFSYEMEEYLKEHQVHQQQVLYKVQSVASIKQLDGSQKSYALINFKDKKDVSRNFILQKGFECQMYHITIQELPYSLDSHQANFYLTSEVGRLFLQVAEHQPSNSSKLQRAYLLDLTDTQLMKQDNKEVELFGGFCQVTTVKPDASLTFNQIELHKTEFSNLSDKTFLPFFLQKITNITFPIDSGSSDEKVPCKDILELYKNNKCNVESEQLYSIMKKIKIEKLFAPYPFFHNSNIFLHLCLSKTFMSFVKTYWQRTQQIILLENFSGVTPLNAYIAGFQSEFISSLLEQLVVNSKNHYYSFLVCRSMIDLMEMKANLIDVLESPLCWAKIEDDFLPRQSCGLQQIVFVDHDYEKKLFTQHLELDQHDQNNVEVVPSYHDPDIKDSEHVLVLDDDEPGDFNDKVNDHSSTVYYESTRSSIFATTQFLKSVVKRKQLTYVNFEFIQCMIKAEMEQYMSEINSNLWSHLFNMTNLFINVYFIHTTPTSSYNFSLWSTETSDSDYGLPGGRQNIFILISKAITTLYLLLVAKEEVGEYQALKSVYFNSVANYFDLGQVINFSLILFFDNDHNATQLTIGLYTIQVTLMFMVLTKHIRMYSEMSFIMTMMTDTMKELSYLLITFMIFALMFSIQFYVIGIPIDSSLQPLYGGGIIFESFEELLGSFGTLDTSSDLNTFYTLLFFVIWFVMVLFMYVIYTNFLIASVSDTYERCFEEKVQIFALEQLSFIIERRTIKNASGEKALEDFIIFNRQPIEAMEEDQDEWHGFVHMIRHTLKKIVDNQKAEFLQIDTKFEEVRDELKHYLSFDIVNELKEDLKKQIAPLQQALEKMN